MRLLPDRGGLRTGLRAFLAALGTLVTLVAATSLAGEPAGAAVLGVVIAFSLARGRRGRDPLVTLLRLPVLTVCVAALAAVLHWRPVVGDALFVAIVFAAMSLRRFGPRGSQLGRLMALPLIALFISPIPVGDAPLHAVGWATAACVAATVWSWLAGLVVGHPATDRTPVAGGAGGAIHTRLAAQSATALALAFLAGHLLVPDHWSWTVVTAFVVTIDARSRGHVVLKSVRRLAGAVLGTVLATLVAALLDGRPAGSVLVILVLLAAGLVLREADYAYWSFCLTGMLAILYGLVGQSGPAVLGERLVGILLGAVAGVLPACLLRPVRTESVVRRHLSRTLESVGELLTGSADPAELHHRLAELRTAAEPALAWHRVLGLLRVRRPAGLAACVAPLVACVDDLAGVEPAELAVAGPTLRRNVGIARQTLARRPAAELLPAAATGSPVLSALDGTLRAVAAAAR